MKKLNVEGSFDQEPNYQSDPEEDQFLSQMEDDLDEIDWPLEKQFKKYVGKRLPRKVAEELTALYPKLNFKYKKKLKKYVDDKAILLLGPPGTGKTFSACCIPILAHKYSNYFFLGSDIRLYHISDLLDKFRELVMQKTVYLPEGQGRNVYDDFIYTLTRRDKWLILDDLGAEKPTDFAFEVLDRIVNHRYERNQRMIITSNYSFDELSQMEGYSRICSRLIDMAGGKIIHLEKVLRKQKVVTEDF